MRVAGRAEHENALTSELIESSSEADQKRLSAWASQVVIAEAERRMLGVSLFPVKTAKNALA